LATPIGKGLTFQDLILTLQNFWAQQGCVVIQPYDMEMGAGTFHTATFLRALGPETWKAAYVQPSRRPSRGQMQSGATGTGLPPGRGAPQPHHPASSLLASSSAAGMLRGARPSRSHPPASRRRKVPRAAGEDADRSGRAARAPQIRVVVQAHHLPHPIQKRRRSGLTVHPIPRTIILHDEPDIAADQEGLETPPRSHYQVKMTC